MCVRLWFHWVFTQNIVLLCWFIDFHYQLCRGLHTWFALIRLFIVFVGWFRFLLSVVVSCGTVCCRDIVIPTCKWHAWELNVNSWLVDFDMNADLNQNGWDSIPKDLDLKCQWVNCACMQAGGFKVLTAECCPLCLLIKEWWVGIKVYDFDINFSYCMYDVIFLTPLSPQMLCV